MAKVVIVKRDADATRQRILDAGAVEIHRHGFRNASVDRILADTGLTKGAFYHHFAAKADLGYAVIDECVRAMVLSKWVEPMEASGDPISGLITTLSDLGQDELNMACDCGCPLNNLAQEMSAIDETFRTKLLRVYAEWQDRTAAALFRGQGAGHVGADVDCRKAATFIISSIEGAAGLAKNHRDPAVLFACMEGMVRYLASLRPAARAQAS
jgi:TetR/AcrR family transcriptional repressor of nem operon